MRVACRPGTARRTCLTVRHQSGSWVALSCLSTTTNLVCPFGWVTLFCIGPLPESQDADDLPEARWALVNVRARDPVSPQARGRELAREGRVLWQEYQSVKRAAAELMSRYRDVPCLQAYRYACGLSQDQAAARYNTETGNQTAIGGTSINAWETWARGRGAGSPPSFPSLLLLVSPMAAVRWGSPMRTSRRAIWLARRMSACRSKTRCRCGSSPRGQRRHRWNRRPSQTQGACSFARRGRLHTAT